MRLRLATFVFLLSAPVHAEDACTPAEEQACQGNGSVDLVPLPDVADYQGFEGGLYAGGGNERPVEHACAGLESAASVVPLASDGTPDAGGRIVLMSIGYSNTTQEFTEFRNLFENAPAWPARNPSLLAVDGAIGGRDASEWAPSHPDSNMIWGTSLNRLTNPGFGGTAGVTADQVQVLWLKHALARPQQLADNAYACGSPCGEFPGHAVALQILLEEVVGEAEARFPNLKMIYLSTRTSAYVVHPSDGVDLLNAEPYAYEAGFAAKWFIDARMGGPGAYATWGPYIWAHSDCLDSGFRWCCGHVGNDFTHPSNAGRIEVARALMSFFSEDPTASSWFLADPPDPPPCAEPPTGTTGGATDTGSEAGSDTAPSEGTTSDALPATDEEGSSAGDSTADASGAETNPTTSTTDASASDEGGKSGCACTVPQALASRGHGRGRGRAPAALLLLGLLALRRRAPNLSRAESPSGRAKRRRLGTRRGTSPSRFA